MIRFYTLDDAGQPLPCDDVNKWGEWYEANQERRVLRVTQITDRCRLSTVFLGLDHNFLMTGPPVLWETLVLGGKYEGHLERYFTKDEALMRHGQLAVLLKRGIDPTATQAKTLLTMAHDIVRQMHDRLTEEEGQGKEA